MSLAPPPFQAWGEMPGVWRRWFQTLFNRVGGSPDATLAPLASPTFTGIPAVPTAAVDTNTTQVASTAFVLGQAASATPAMDGTAAAGASTRYARGDHVHPTDTSRAPLASPAFTGTPTAPTPAAGDSSTKIATTAFVATATPGTFTAGTNWATPTAYYLDKTADGSVVFNLLITANAGAGTSVGTVPSGHSVYGAQAVPLIAYDNTTGALVVAYLDGTGHTLTLAAAPTAGDAYRFAGSWRAP